jgi:S1-C subfamily serine protease
MAPLPSDLGIRGAPPAGSPGGPLVALAASGSDANASGRRPDLGPDAGRSSAGGAMRPQTLDGIGRAIVRIRVNSAGGKGPGSAGSQPDDATGLGFLVDGRGYVLTHDYLVRDAKGVEVALPDGRKPAVKQVWRDQLAGIAVLKIDGAGLPALQLGESGGLRVGDAAMLVGWPTAASQTTARATIRATGSATGGNLALDAPVSAEYAGSPLVDQRGHVVGIATTDIHSTDQTGRGGFAIPIDRAKSMLRQAQSTAGVQVRPSTPPVR